VTKARNKGAALAFMKKTLKRHGLPEAITTDGLRSYRAPMKDLGNEEKQEVSGWANNRADNNHLSFRRRERAILRFRGMKTLQKFASIHANVHNGIVKETGQPVFYLITSHARRTSFVSDPQSDLQMSRLRYLEFTAPSVCGGNDLSTAAGCAELASATERNSGKSVR
jgi:hypothetical protein